MEIAAGESRSVDDSRLAPVPWTPRDVLIGVVLFAGLFIVGSVFFGLPTLFFEDESQGYWLAGIIGSIPVYIGIAALGYRLTAGRFGGGLAQLGVAWPRADTFGWAGAAVVGAFVFSIIYGLFVSIPGLEFMQAECDDQIDLAVRRDALLLAVLSFISVVFAPLAEEVFFRGFAFRGLLRWGLFPAAIVSAALFGAAHLINPLLYRSLIPITGIGVVFALSFYKSRNLLTPITAHFTYNLLVTLWIAASPCDPS